MKTLNEFNNERLNEHYREIQEINKPRKNGISCPNCGKELFDTTPAFTLMSNPPQMNVHCVCGYKGYRIA